MNRDRPSPFDRPFGDRSLDWARRWSRGLSSRRFCAAVHRSSQKSDEGSFPADPEKGNTNSVSPYIDSVRGNAPQESSEGYTQQLKQKLGPEGNGSTTSYTDDEKAKLGPGDQDSAIAQVQEGRSELKYEKRGEIKNSFGLIYGVDDSKRDSSRYRNRSTFQLDLRRRLCPGPRFVL